MSEEELTDTEQKGGEAEEPQEVAVDPRIYINAFPKSGTHLMEQLVRCMAFPIRAEKPWAGSFMDHSWTTKWAPTRGIYRRLGLIRDGEYCKGHMGFKDAIEMFLWGNRVATVFLYRDLRDVAVSLTYHIIDRHGSHSHPEWYEPLGKDGAMLAVIEGLTGHDEEKGGDVTYQGVVERWNQYAGWLNVPWVEKFKYEELLGDREAEARRLIHYVTRFCVEARGLRVHDIPDEMVAEKVAQMVEASNDTEHSPTFRKGVSGEWRHEFNEEHVEAFKREDEKWARAAGLESGSWLVHLGYEDSTDWGL